MTKAIILAGGKGERLRPYTEDRPKAMVPIMANPLLTFQLQWLKTYGINEVMICCGYRHQEISDYFNDGSQLQMKLEYLIEPEPLGRGGALKSAFKQMQLSSGDVVALNGDCITNLNLNECISAHRTSGAMASVIAVPLVSPYGVLEIEENKKITGFKEKPNLPYWINAGIYVLNSEITELLPDIGDHETTTFPQLAKQGLLNSFTTNAFWRTIDTIKDLNEVRSDMERFLLSAFFQPVVANAQSYAP